LPEFYFRKGRKGDSVLTELRNGLVEMKKKRPAILVSSSSWTEDEDFHLLADALDGNIFYPYFFVRIKIHRDFNTIH